MNCIFKLFIFGDIGYFSKNLTNLSYVSYIRKQINDKYIFLGDNFYNDGVKDLNDSMWNIFCETFSYMHPQNMHAILGNHDYHQNPTSQINNIFWNTPSFYYKKVYSENTDLFFLDTVQLLPEHCNITINKIQSVHDDNINNIIYKQITWLDYELDKSSIKNKIVFGHYPILTNGYYKDRLSYLYSLLYPIFKKHNVTAYISGHEHNIQHIKHFDNNYTFNQFIVGSSSENRMHENPHFSSSMLSYYNNQNNHILEISEHNNSSLIFSFINQYENIEYSIII